MHMHQVRRTIVCFFIPLFIDSGAMVQTSLQRCTPVLLIKGGSVARWELKTAQRKTVDDALWVLGPSWIVIIYYCVLCCFVCFLYVLNVCTSGHRKPHIQQIAKKDRRALENHAECRYAHPLFPTNQKQTLLAFS